MEAPTVQYVGTSDGFDIAYTRTGEGQPYVMMPYLFNHLSRPNAAQSALIERLCARFCVVRYDSRGMGFSTRGLDEGHEMAAYERDLETVVDVLGLSKFVLQSSAVFGHAGIRFAVRHPERVSGLILWRTAVNLQDVMPLALWEGLAQENWDLFLESFLGGTMAGYTITPEARIAGKEAMKAAMSQEDWLAGVRAWRESSVEGEVGRLAVPTLVLVEDRSALMPANQAVRLAARIPGAQLAVSEPGSGVDGTFIAIDAFVSGLQGGIEDRVSEMRAGGPPLDSLSARQVQVLRLIAEGKTTREIAEELVLSERTVERHIADIYAKIGARNRAEATAYALSRLT